MPQPAGRPVPARPGARVPWRGPWPVRTSRPTDESELMGDKSPKKQNVKKPSKTLKEKRADKQSKREDKRPGFGH